jgi:hypothetical protein
MRTMDLRTRVTVYCGDKRYGILQKVVVDPHDGHITDLIVEPAAREAPAHVVPVSVVTRVGVNKVHLGLSARQIDRYPIYPPPSTRSAWVNPLEKGGAPTEETRLGTRPFPDVLHLPDWLDPPEAGHGAAGAGAVEHACGSAEGLDAPIAPGAPVLCADGQLATVDRVVVDPDTQQWSYLALRHRQAASYRLVPVACTAHDADGLILTAEAWNSLPAYIPRGDGEIFEEIRATLLAEVEVVEHEYERLDVTVEDGFVTLLGSVKGEKLLAEVLARVSKIAGIIDLRADVVTNA